MHSHLKILFKDILQQQNFSMLFNPTFHLQKHCKYTQEYIKHEDFFFHCTASLLNKIATITILIWALGSVQRLVSVILYFSWTKGLKYSPKKILLLRITQTKVV